MTSRRSLDRLWEEFCPTQSLSIEAFDELVWHIENDEEPGEAMCLAADMGLLEAAPHIAKQLKHEDSYERGFAASHLCRLLSRGHKDIEIYAEKLYHAAKYDDYIGNRSLMASFMGYIIDAVSRETQTKIAELLLQYSQALLDIKFVYGAMLRCVGELGNGLESPPMYPDFVDEAKVQKFREKYRI